MILETEDLIQRAQGKEYLDFKEQAIEMLKQKTAEKLSEKGYFDRLDQAKGLDEGENPFAKKKDDKDSDDNNDKDSDNDKDYKDDKEDKDDKKVNEKYDIVDFIMDYEGGDMSDDDIVKGFSKLMKQGLHTKLQGSYGRAARDLVQSGYLDTKGNIKKLPSQG